jgi:urease accessory protein UreH
MSVSGSVDLACDVRGERSRVTEMCCSGLSRASRAFADRDGAARVVLTTLGPGIIAGDEFATTGVVQPRSALVTTGQMATPVFAGAKPSRSRAAWTVLAHGMLCAINEPLMLEPSSRHVSQTYVDAERSGVAVLADTVAFRGSASLSTLTVARVDGNVVLWDAMKLTQASTAGHAIGTAIIVAADPALRAAIESAIQSRCAALDGAVRAGIGGTSASIVVRVSSNSVWRTHEAVRTIAETAREIGNVDG